MQQRVVCYKLSDLFDRPTDRDRHNEYGTRLVRTANSHRPMQIIQTVESRRAV